MTPAQVFAAAIHHGPTAAAVSPMPVAALGVAVGRRAVDSDDAGFAEFQLFLEMGYGFPGYGPVAGAAGTDCAADTDDVRVNAGQFIEVIQLQVAGEGGAEAGLLGFHHHLPQAGFRDKVKEVAAVFGQGVNQETVAHGPQSPTAPSSWDPSRRERADCRQRGSQSAWFHSRAGLPGPRAGFPPRRRRWIRRTPL